MDWQRHALHGHSGRRFRLSEVLEDRMLLTAFVVDQQLVNATTGPINITNTTIDVDSDGTPEFDSIIVDAVSFDGIGGRAINITLSDLTLTQIAVHDTTISGTQGQGVNISLDNIRLDSLSIEGSSINSSIGGGVGISLTDVRLPELTIAQTTIAGGIDAGLTVDIVSQTINSVIDEFDITESNIDGVDINARGLRKTIFSAQPTNPLELTVVDHGLQDGTLATVSGVQGLTAANTEDVIGLTSPPDENLIVLQNTDGTGQAPYAGGGTLTVFTDIGCLRVTGNTIAGASGDDGLSIDFTDVRSPHVEIENNVEIDSIDITLSQSPIDGLTIRNNTRIDGDRPQVDAINFNLTESTLTNLIIDQNTIQRNGAAGGEGVVFDATDSNVYGTFTNNVVDNTLGNGLLFNATATDEFVARNRGPAVFDFNGFSSETTLTSEIDATSSTIEVVDARAFQPQQIILIDHEQFFIESISGNTLTVLRGERGTLAVPHADGARIRSVTSSVSGTPRAISGNTFSNNQFAGVGGTFLINSSIEADIRGNQFLGNQRRGIDIVAQDTRALQTAVARGGISRVASTLNVTDASPFAGFATPFDIQVEGETLTVTDVTDNVLTVVRGVNGTQAASHPTNATVVAASGDAVKMTVGGSDLADANLFDGNQLGAYRLELQDDAAGSFSFTGNTVINTDSNAASGVATADDAVEVVLTGTDVDAQASATLRRSDISNNRLGVDSVSSLTNAITVGTQVFLVADGNEFAANDSVRLDGELLQVASVSGNIITLTGGVSTAHEAGALLIGVTGRNDGRGIDVFFDEQTAIEDLQITNNVIANNLDDGIRIRREDEAETRTVDPAVGQTRSITIAGNTVSNNAINPAAEQLDTTTSRQYGAGIEIVALNGSQDSIDVEIRDNAVLSNRRAGGAATAATNGIQLRAEADAQMIIDMRRNVVMFNEGDGVNYTTRENADTDRRDIGGLLTENVIASNDQNGIELSGRFGVFNILEIGREGTDPDTGASRGNIISENGLHGITVRRGGNATIANNVIDNNGQNPNGLNFIQLGAASIAGNNINAPQEILGSGINVQNGDANGTSAKLNLNDGTAPGTGGGDLSPQVSLVIKSNNIEANAAMGIDINSRVDIAEIAQGRDFEAFTGESFYMRSDGAPGVQATIRNNLITQNNNDGIELSGPIQATLLGNFVDRNQGRGIDILSFGDADDTVRDPLTLETLARQSNILIGNGEEAGRNVVVGNRQEGIYYVSSAEFQDTNLLSTNGNSRLANGDVNGSPATILQVDTNTITSNGVDSALTGTGLVFWIGSSGAVTSNLSGVQILDAKGYSSNTFLGLETSIGTVGGVADATHTNYHGSLSGMPFTRSLGTRTEINSRTNARVVNNTFEGNFGDDVRIQPFISTVDPRTTVGDWATETPGAYNVTFYESDPLSRLNLVFNGNSGNGLDVRQLTDGYTNAEDAFKSRDINAADGDLPVGPFSDPGTRFRDITRVPSRVHGAEGIALEPFDAPDVDDNSSVDATYNIIDIQRVDVGNGIQELMVTVSPRDTRPFLIQGNNPYLTLPFTDGATVEITQVEGVNGKLHTANGLWQVRDVDPVAHTFILQNTAGDEGPDYAGGGFLHANLSTDQATFPGSNILPSAPFQYPGLGASTFRVAQGFDTAGTSPQDEFNRGDGFDGGPDGDGPLEIAVTDVRVLDQAGFGVLADWGIWVPNDTLNGVITDVTYLTGDMLRISSENHGLTHGRLIEISGVEGFPAANDVFTVQVIDANTFEVGPFNAIREVDDPHFRPTVEDGSYIRGGEWKTRDESFPLPLAPTFPVSEVDAVTPDPRSATPGLVTVEFTEPVTAFDVDDVYLTRDGVPVDLASVIVQQVSATSFTVDVTNAGDAEGQYELIIDNTFPEATIVPITPDPIVTPVGVVTINFTENVTGVDIFDFVLSRDTGNSNGFQSIDLSEIGANLAVTQISPSQYSIDLTSVTFENGSYRLALMAQRTGDNAVELDGISTAGGMVTINSQFHGLATGQTVTLSSVRGDTLGPNTVLNDSYRIVVLDEDNFVLYDDTLTTPIAPDDTGYEAGLPAEEPLGNWSFDSGIVDRVGRPFGVDRFGIIADATDTWVHGNVAPTGDIIDISPDPRNSAIDSAFVRFSEPVRISQVNASDFVLTRDIGNGPVDVPLDSFSHNPVALDDPTGTGYATLFEIPNLVAVTGAFPTDTPDQVVTYRLTLRNTDSSRITDRQGSFLTFPAFDEWTFTPVGPAPTIATVFPDPRMTGASTVTVVFNEAVSGITTGDSVSDYFTLTRDSGDGNGPQTVSLVDPSNNMPLTLTLTSSTSLVFDLSPVTTDGGNSIDGSYVLTLNRGTGIFAVSDGEQISVDAVDSWLQDSQGPNGEILDIDPDPRVASAGVVTVVFDERVTGVDRFNAATDFTLTRDRGDGAGPQAVSLAGIRVRPINPVDALGNPVADPFDTLATVFTDRYVIDLNGPITDTFGTYVLSLTDTGSITDETGNAFVAGTDAVDSWKRLRKTINDRVIDSVFPGNPIPAYGGQDPSPYEVPNYVVNDAYETFFVDLTPPQVVPGSVNVQPDPRSTAAGLITIEFTEAVTGFNLTDLVLTRDANDGNGPQPVSLSGLTLNKITSSIYTIDLNLKTGAPGTYSLGIQGSASLIQDLAGNPIQTGLITLDSWTVENTGPSATVTVSPEFRNIATDNDPILVTFSKAVDVSQVDVTDFRLERDGGSGFVVVADSLAGAASTLDAAIDASQTTITVADGSVFPAVGGFRVSIGSELLNVTAVSGNVLTVERGAEGSTAAAHSASDAVTLASAVVAPAASSTLVGNITAATTAITVVDGTVFPSSGTFDVTIGSEVVTVTGVVGNTLTVSRGAGATAHGNGEAVAVTFDDTFSLDLSASGLIDVTEARYRITLVATNSGIVDESSIELSSDVSAVWQLDRTTPVANVVDVLPDPLQLGATTPSAGTVNILFDEPVENVDISDFELYRDGVLEPGLASLTVNAEPPEPGAPARRYTIDLSSLTNTVGMYELRVLAGGIQDLAGNNLEAPNPVEFLDDEGRVLTLAGPTAGVAAADQWEAGPDAVAPEVVTVVDSNGQTIPATVFNSVGVLKVTFSEEVTGFDVDDVTLTLNGSNVPLPAGSVTQFLGSNATWLLDLASATAEPGSYVLQIRNDGATQSITDLNGNVLAEDSSVLTPAGVSTEVRWEFQIGEPNASIVAVSPDPRLRPAGVVTVDFSDDVNGVDISDFRLTRVPEGGSTALPVSLQSVEVVMSAQGPDQYILDLTSLTGAPGTYTLTLVSEGSGIEAQTTMAPLRTDATETWTTFDVIDLRSSRTSPQIDVTFGDAADAVPGDERVDTNASTADGEQRSLRSAVQTANALTGDDTILLAAGTYTLTIGGPVGENAAASGDLDITDTTGALTIRGQGVTETVIDAGGLFRVFHVLDGATLILEDLTITGGLVTGSDDGAGLRNDGGTVTLNNVRVTGNVSQDDGGGINNAGLMTIINSTLDLNTAAASGGAIRNVGRLTVINSTIGGRFDLTDPLMPIDERNQAGLNGGGLVNVGGGTAMIVGTTISGNVAGGSGGGVRNSAVTTAQTTSLASDITAGQTTLTVSDASVFPMHEGFVIRIDTEDMLVTGVNANTLTVTRGFNGTTAAAHTALSVTSQTSSLSLINTTISGNTADSRGGGLSTAGGFAVVANTLISGNTAVIAGPEVSTASAPSSLLSAGNNLVFDTTDAAGVFVQMTDLVGVDPLLEPLADNGGPTLTHAILLGSPAIDAGQVVSDETDQRGVPRVLGNGIVDIGAYEFGGFFVNSTADSIDINPGDGLPLDVFGRATLRAAVMEANALAANGSSTQNAIMLGSQVYDLSLTEIDRTAPTATFTPVSPDPLAAAPTMTGDPAVDPVDSIVVTFSEPVHGVGGVATPISLSSFRLTYDDGLGGGLVDTLDNIVGVEIEMTSQNEATGETVYTISGLEDTFAADGMYTLELLVVDPVDPNNSLVDFALTPNVLAEEMMGSGIAAAETFIRNLDIFPPTGSISQVTTPRTTNPGIVTLTFNEQVIGVTSANFTLDYDDGTGMLQSVDVSSVSPQIISETEIIFDLTSVFDFNSLTDVGNYTLTFDGTNIGDASGNLFGQTLTTAWTLVVDTFAPVPTIDEITPDPRLGTVGTVTVDFDEDVTGVDLADAETDFDLWFDEDGAAGPLPEVQIDLTGIQVVEILANQYTLDLSTVTTADGSYRLEVSSDGLIEDLALPANPLAEDAALVTQFGRMGIVTIEEFVIGDSLTAVVDPANLGQTQVTDGGAFQYNPAAFGDLDVTAGTLTLIGNSSVASLVDANSIDRAFDVDANASIIVRNAGITGGQVLNDRDGGAIRSFGSVELDGALLSGNSAGGNGGGLYVETASTGTVTITDSEVSGNVADFGGGVFNNSSTQVIVTDSVVTANAAMTDGGGIFNDRTGSLSMTGTTLSGNTAGRNGAGFYNNDLADVSISDSTLTSNAAALGGGGLFNELAATATIANSTIAFNSATDGAGVYNDDGTVTISISAVSANTASTDGGGAFVTSNGVLNVANSSFSGNMADANGGGLASDGTVTLDNVRVIDNSAGQNGAGIANTRQLTLQQVTLTQNDAGQDGGGLWNAGIGNALVTDSSLTENTAGQNGGGIHNSGSAVLGFTRSTISDGAAAEKGGGLYQNSLGLVEIVNATVSTNAATDGGGIYTTSRLTFSNSTLSTNTASNNGGGIDNNGGAVSFASATVFGNIAGNAGGGIINESVFGAFGLKNTIVARNQINGNPPNADVDVSGVQFNSVGNNLIGDRGSVTTFIDGANADVIGVAGNEVDPLLGPLQDNGGPTLTHALLFGSPARDAGTNVGVLTTDQRGFARIFDGDGDGLATADIGAFESGFVVNTFEDTVDVLPGDQASADRDGNSSLRAAVMESNALAGDDTILLIPGTYTLTIAGRSEDAAASGDLDVSDNLTIIGAGTDQTFIDAAELDRVFHVLPGARLNLKNLTIRGGNALEGGGLLNQGFTTLENVIVRDNTADFGAGLLNDLVTTALAANMTTTTTTVMVTDGSVFPAQGVFDIRIGTEEIRVTAVSDTTYSVIRGVNGTTAVAHTAADTVTLVQSMDLIDTVVANNAARIQGGGLFNRNELTLTRAVFSGNTANSKGGGLFNESSVAAATSILDTTFDSNVATVAGGGIYNNSAQGANPGRITITGSTLSNNRAGVRGGAIFNNDIVTLLNSTVSTNSANSIGGGIYNAVLLDPADGVTVLSAGSATLTNVTVVRNSTDGTGGGIVNVDGATASLRNTIVAANSASAASVDLQGVFTTLGTNFIGQAAQSTGLTNGVMGDQVGSASSPFDPVIGPLSDNGGPTLTHALQTGSPAIDAGDNSGGEPVDQRAGRRPTDNTADIGAFEIQENRISIADLQKLEGPGGSTLFVFSVILEQTTAEPISVDFTTFQGTARSGSDFQPVSGTLNFAPGDLTRTITVEVFGDTTPEDDETFQVILSNPVNGVLTTSSATGTILNDDAFVRVDDVDIAEGDSGQTNAVFTVSLSAPLQETATITYSTADDTANAGNDYETRSGTLTFLPGETSMTVEVPINGDLIVEPHETFFLNLTSAVGASGDNLTVLDGQGLGTIQNDDILISVAPAAGPVAENAGNYPFTVSLSQPNAFDVTVNVSTMNGTATSGLDYTALSNVTVTIPAGTTSVTQNVAILNDGTFEGGPGTTETLNLELLAGTVTRDGVANTDAVLSGPATGEIEDDEPRPIEFLIRLNGAGDTIEVVQDDGINPPAVIQSTTDLVAAYEVDGTNSNDVFIVDFVNGNPIPTNGLTVHGLDQTSGDSLELRDSSGVYPTATNIVYTAVDANSGSVDIDGSIVNYTGLEPITDSLDAVNRTFDSTGVSSDHDISVSDAGGMTVINDNGTAAFESITFRNPSTSLTLNAGDGNNTISLNSIDSAFAASFTLNAGGGDDSVDASGFNFAAAINGEAGDDVITGSANDDTITGGLGADSLSGGDGADTIRGNDSINPDDDASDTIFGNGGADVIDGEGGDDVIDGGLSGDMITGGAGNDQITGGSGNDTVSGGDGDDNVLGGSGNDELTGDAGNDTLDGEAGDDVVDGGADDDVVSGGADNDTVLGGDGNDVVNGNDGDDDVQGGTGNDTLDGGAGTNMLDGGADTDTISVTATGTQNITLTDSDLTVGGEVVTYTSVEQFILNGSDQANNIDASGYSGDVSIFGGDGNDTLTGGSGNDSIVGEGGNDTVSGGAGSDTLLGGAGKDSITGGDGADNISGQSGADTLVGGDGDDTLDGGDDPDSILGGDGNDDASGGTGNDTLEGELGDDTLRGDDGNDELSGGEDDDSLFGGNGADNLLGDAGDDKLIGNSGQDTLNGGAGEDSALGGSGDDLLIGGEGNDILDGQGSSNDVITLPGTTLDDTFTFNRSEALVLLQKTSGTSYSAILRRAERVELNTLDGNDSVTVGDLTGADGYSTFVLDMGTGDDVLAAASNRNTAFTFAVSAGAGNDSLFGGEGADVLNGDAGNDLIHGRGGNDTISGGLGADYVVGFAGDDVISGDEDNDTLLGSAGLDLIYGNDGNDSIRGNGGFDTIDGGDGEDTLRGDGSGDDIYGGAGRDLIEGGGGNDDIFGGDGNDIISGGTGEDYILGGSGNDAISGGAENDRIIGNAGRDLLLGEDGNDTLIGGAHQDLLVGGVGADFLRGNGSRNDTLVGENGGDTPDPGDVFHPADAAEVDNAFIIDPGVFDLFNF
jgi:Ca2+-binding RTX toxin-like protein